MKTNKVISVCLSAVLACGSALTFTNNTNSNAFTNQIIASAAISNYIGDGLTWEYDSSTRTLTISGTGKMKDFAGINSIPWRTSASEIKKVIISNGVESIGNYAFAMFSSMRFIEIPDSVQRIGKFVFYNSALEAVEMNSTTRTIDESSFKNTPYYRNKFTTERNSRMNAGAAKNMTGRQLVVNIFPSEIRAVLGQSTPIDQKYVHDYENEYAPSYDVENVVDYNNESVIDYDNEFALCTGFKFYKYQKRDIKYTFISSWGYNDSIEFVSNINEENSAKTFAKSLASVNYAGLVENESSTFAPNATTDNIKDYYVTSSEIQNTLSTVQEALDDLENQAADYGQYLEFIMTPDTNFYYTYNNWDDNVQYDYTVMGHPATINPIKGNDSQIIHWASAGKLFQRLSDEAGLDLMLYKDQINRDDYTSALTKQLMSEYDVNGVVYIVHIDAGYPVENLRGSAWATDTADLKEKANTEYYKTTTDEHCVIICEDKLTIMHEMCHLYGAEDYYPTTAYNNPVDYPKLPSGRLYTTTYYQNLNADLMSGSEWNNNPDHPKIGADTAYSIGWNDCILKDTFEVLFNKKNYPFGDVNMDGVVDAMDSYCIGYYNLYKEFGNFWDYPTASLTPVSR